jgi:hypothetical protein
MATVTKQQLIEETILDYYEGWYDGDLARIGRAMHPELVKRNPAPGRQEPLELLTKQQMLDLTAEGEGTREAADRRIEIDNVDIYEDIAAATVRSAPYYEYLQLLRTDDGWRIAQALWRDR